MLAYIKLTVESVFVPMQGDGLQLPDKRECARVSTKKTPNGQLCNRHEGFFLQYGGCFHGFMCILLLRKRVFRFQSETQWLAVEY